MTAASTAVGVVHPCQLSGGGCFLGRGSVAAIMPTRHRDRFIRGHRFGFSRFVLDSDNNSTKQLRGTDPLDILAAIC